MKKMNLSGIWQATLPSGAEGIAILPGTLDTNGLGEPDRPEKQWHAEVNLGRAEDDAFGENPIHTRFTRRFTSTGPASFRREIELPEMPSGLRPVVYVERSRQLRLYINGQEAETLLPGTLNTPWRFDAAGLRPGKNELRFVADNSYPGWPAGAIIYSSAATDETQTNWNGLLGEISLAALPPVMLLNPRMIPDRGMKTCSAAAEVIAPADWAGGTVRLTLRCGALAEGEASCEVPLAGGAQTVTLSGVPLRGDLRLWQMEDSYLYSLSAEMEARSPAGESCRDQQELPCGFRRLEADERHRLCLNGRRILLRSEANCAAWPETGHPPMEEEAWERIIRQYQAYGVNCLRFHSHCPPEAAFAAADRLGMLMQPELSQWDPEHALESEESWAYYRTELEETLRMLGRHPSFVMLTMGNELHAGDRGVERMEKLVRQAKKILPDRLYAWGSNAFYGARGCDPESDFYTAQNYGRFQMRAISAAQDEAHPDQKTRIRGYLNNDYPDGKHNYSEGMAALRENCAQPLFSFEVGQYEVLPDFHELDLFHGVTDPINYRLILRRAEKQGLMPLWDRMVEATGELALIGYREEVEAVMRTPLMSGISLLSLQDFPGQGTALVGMLNAHLLPKPFPFARAERFEAFYRDSLPLLEMEKYTYQAGETLRAGLRAVNYGSRALEGTLRITLRAAEAKQDAPALAEMRLPGVRAPQGEAEIVGKVELNLPPVEAPLAALLQLELEEAPAQFRNEYRVWIYPEEEPVESGAVIRAKILTEALLRQLEEGAAVLLEPPSEEACFPGGIRGQFSTDFWSVGTFPQQEGGMGLLIDDQHPLFRHFPTSFHTDYQWWLMAGQRAMRLPDESLAAGILVRQMDSYSQLRSMAMLMELRVGKGKILISSMGLAQLPQKPEVRALRNALVKYAGSADFNPRVSVTPEALKALLPGCVEKE